MTFLPGQSGNPAGRPRGARNQKTIALESLLDDQSEALLEKMIGRAKNGDDLSLRLCVERMMAPRRERPVPLALPRIETDADARQASANVIAALGEGEITPKEAEHLLRTVAAAGVIIQSSEIIARLIRLEEGLARLIAAQTPLQITAAS